MRQSFVTIPGIDGSGASHWQTRWEAEEPRFVRFSPRSWIAPQLDDWIEALDRTVAQLDSPILVAHSLGCLLVAYWAEHSSSAVAGAFLVSVPDPASASFPAAAASFSAPPTRRLRFPSLVVASSTDPFGTVEYQRTIATRWDAGFVQVGDAGHINEASGVGEWALGRDLLTSFAAGTRE